MVMSAGVSLCGADLRGYTKLSSFDGVDGGSDGRCGGGGDDNSKGGAADGGDGGGDEGVDLMIAGRSSPVGDRDLWPCGGKGVGLSVAGRNSREGDRDL